MLMFVTKVCIERWQQFKGRHTRIVPSDRTIKRSGSPFILCTLFYKNGENKRAHDSLNRIITERS